MSARSEDLRTMPSAKRKPAARSRSSPGVRIVTTAGGFGFHDADFEGDFGGEEITVGARRRRR